jgi:hypothetical protein
MKTLWIRILHDYSTVSRKCCNVSNRIRTGIQSAMREGAISITNQHISTEVANAYQIRDAAGYSHAFLVYDNSYSNCRLEVYLDKDH